VEIALRPAIVGTLLQAHQFFRGKIWALLRPIELWPILRQLIAAVHGGIDFSRGAERETLAVAEPRNETLRRRESLPGSVGVIAPGTRSRFELGAWIDTRGLERAVLDLAGIGSRTEVDIHIAPGIDRKRMHGMVAGERQARDNHLGRFRGGERSCRQSVAHDAIVHFRIKRAVVERYAGAA